jgi:hypothetical protein
MTEEAWGALNSPHISSSSLMRNLGWPWKSWVNKFYSLLMQWCITLLPGFAGKSSSQTVIVVGVDGKKHHSSPPLLYQNSIFYA